MNGLPRRLVLKRQLRNDQLELMGNGIRDIWAKN